MGAGLATSGVGFSVFTETTRMPAGTSSVTRKKSKFTAIACGSMSGA